MIELAQAKDLILGLNSNENMKNKPASFTLSQMRRNWLFYFVVSHRTANKGTKIYNAHAKPLFCSLSPLSSVVFLLPSCFA